MAGKNAPPEINASSMADIAFLLLVFFLVTTTMDSDLGLSRLLPPPLPPEIEKPPQIKDRNIFEVLVNSNDQLLVEGDIMQIAELTEATKEFVGNPSNDESLPEKELKEVADKVKALSRDLETAHKYLKELINEQEVLKDAVDRNIDLLFFDGDEWDE